MTLIQPWGMGTAVCSAQTQVKLLRSRYALEEEAHAHTCAYWRSFSVPSGSLFQSRFSHSSRRSLGMSSYTGRFPAFTIPTSIPACKGATRHKKKKSMTGSSSIVHTTPAPWQHDQAGTVRVWHRDIRMYLDGVEEEHAVHGLPDNIHAAERKGEVGEPSTHTSSRQHFLQDTYNEKTLHECIVTHIAIYQLRINVQWTPATQAHP